jgi:hypothetical protein
VEIGGNAGYVFSEGVDMPGIEVNGQRFNKIGPKDAFSWGFNADLEVPQGWCIGFLWNRQESTLEATGTRDLDVGNMHVDNYHGVVTFNLGIEGASVRPYIYGGLGATSYGSVEFNNTKADGETRFSSTWGAGIKAFRGQAGLKLGMHWTPTYIKSDPAGMWCDPFYGCYQASDAQYSHQFELLGGLVYRFPLRH